MNEELQLAIELYNRGEYLESQVRFEEAMAQLQEPERPLAQALLTLAGAMHLYFHRGGGRGTLNLLRRALVVLDDFRLNSLGIAVDDLYEATEAYLQDLESRKSRAPRVIDRWLAPRIRIHR
jgi:tetratricopeptide (TPR) repeat protein